MTIHVRAPATTANLGPGFDVAGVAFDLWNELEVGEGERQPVDETHLGVRAFSRYASPDGRSFTFTDRIPRERGLGSSAAVVALGLVAGAIAAGRRSLRRRAARGGPRPSKGTPTTSRPRSSGGVCLTWDGQIARVADDVPAAAIAVVPQTRVNTAEARASLPQDVAARRRRLQRGPRDAARRRARVAATRGCSQPAPTTVCTSRTALRTRRISPRSAAILPDGALGATLSGSGPTVIVWAREGTRARRRRASSPTAIPDARGHASGESRRQEPAPA